MLDANKPTDQEHVAQLPYWIRQSRAAINAFVASNSSIDSNIITLPAGTTGLSIPTHLTVTPMEVVIISADGICNLALLTGGLQGQIKLFVFQDDNIDIIDGTKVGGNFYLNQLPVGSEFEAAIDDILAVVNIGGDGLAINGYWKEIWRQVSVK